MLSLISKIGLVNIYTITPSLFHLDDVYLSADYLTLLLAYCVLEGLRSNVGRPPI